MRYLYRLLSIATLLAPAAVLTHYLSPALSLTLYLAFITLTCLLGAALISSQPVGKATPLGFLGSQTVRWGFYVGQGKLPAAVALSILIWTLLAATLIALLQSRGNLLLQSLIALWAIDLLASMYLLSISLAKWRKLPKPLLPPTLIMAAILTASAILQFGFRSTPLALLLAAAPPLLAGLPYAIFLLFALTLGRKARWN